jgi:hypothetical protein
VSAPDVYLSRALHFDISGRYAHSFVLNFGSQFQFFEFIERTIFAPVQMWISNV